MSLLATIACLPMAALAVTVTPLPPGEFADTEVSTNFAFVVDRRAMSRVEFAVSLDETPTNCVEVAIGTDADGDGNLSVEEKAYVFGYDCGTWFCRGRDGALSAPRRGDASGTVSIGTECQTPCARAEKTFVLKNWRIDTAWNLVKVTRRGCGDVCELVRAEGRKPGLAGARKTNGIMYGMRMRLMASEYAAQAKTGPLALLMKFGRGLSWIVQRASLPAESMPEAPSCQDNMVSRDCPPTHGNAICLLLIAFASVVCLSLNCIRIGGNHCRRWLMNGPMGLNCQVGYVVLHRMKFNQAGWWRVRVRKDLVT